jgi:ParB/RepB/Spo0J family partition protein
MNEKKMMPNRQLQEVAVDRITVPKDRFRAIIDEEQINELAESIKSTGQVESISLLPEKNGKYQLVTGYRRLQAARMAKKRSVWAEILEIDPDEVQLYEAIENLHHVSLTIEEKRNMVGRLWEIAKKKGWTKKDLANKIGMPIKSLEYELSALESLKSGEIKSVREDLDSQVLAYSRTLEPKIRDKYLESLSEERISKHDRLEVIPILRSEKVVPELKEEIVSKKSKIDIEDAKQIAQLKPQDQKAVIEEIKQQDKTFKDIVQDSVEFVKERTRMGIEKTAMKHWADGLTQDPMPIQVANWWKWNRERLEDKFDFFTTHYSGKDLDTFIETLKANGVGTLIDVRDTPFSQFRPEFNKENLSKSLAAKGIAYSHHPELGVPKEQREKLAKTGNWSGFFEWYDKNVVPRIYDVIDSKSKGLTAFMCVEKDPQKCHRHRIAIELEKRGMKSLDL